MGLCSKERGFVFIHPYKCGGTSFRKILLENVPDCVERARSHATADEVRRDFAREGDLAGWERAFKFAFVRNPFDWIVSLYEYILMDGNHPQHAEVAGLNFSGFIGFNIACITDQQNNSNGQYHDLHSFLHDAAGNLLVDFVGRVETFERDSAHVLSRIGLAGIEVGHENRTTRSSDYRAYYGEGDRALVESFFAKDLRAYGYSF